MKKSDNKQNFRCLHWTYCCCCYFWYCLTHCRLCFWRGPPRADAVTDDYFVPIVCMRRAACHGDAFVVWLRFYVLSYKSVVDNLPGMVGTVRFWLLSRTPWPVLL